MLATVLCKGANVPYNAAMSGIQQYNGAFLFKLRENSVCPGFLSFECKCSFLRKQIIRIHKVHKVQNCNLVAAAKIIAQPIHNNCRLVK